MRKKNHQIDTLFALLLYSMFAVLSLLIVLLGSQVYRRVVTESNARNDVRVTLSYVTNKIHAGDAAGRIRLEEREGINVLVLEDNEAGTQFETLIYFYDGKLRESLQTPADRFMPGLGISLVSADDFSIREADGVFIITAIGKDKKENVMYVSKRT